MQWYAKGAVRAFILGCGVLVAQASAWAATSQPVQSVYLEELTSPEVRQRVAEGATTILVPIGGTEQNGPHMALGKHNVRVHLLAGRIAQALGQTLVAPTLAYVPEGSIQPPVAHMRFAGTISIPDSAFEALLEGAARSFRQHGFRDVVFLPEHGGYQKNVARVAARINQAWRQDACCRAHALTQYYAATQTPFQDQLAAKGYTRAEIGAHAGLADTSLSLALDPSLVRSLYLNPQAPKPTAADGVVGDPRRASAEAGQWGVQMIVDASVAAIREVLRRHAAP